MRPTRFELATFGLKGRGSLAWGVDFSSRCDPDATRIRDRLTPEAGDLPMQGKLAVPLLLIDRLGGWASAAIERGRRETFRGSTKLADTRRPTEERTQAIEDHVTGAH